jgi:thiamine biosynthesis lipoprotein
VNEPHRFRAMGCEVVVAGASAAARRAVERLFAEREQRFSRFLPDSELSRLNRSTRPLVAVSAEFASTLAVALDAAAQTDGLVDPTLGRAVAGAGYDRDFAEVGDDERPAAPGPRGRWREIRVQGSLVERPVDVELDLAGVVKALAVDAAADLLDGPGWVSAGGDIATRGAVDVALPGGGAARLVSGGMATSGTVRRRWRRDGILQHHLVDPGTGRPSTSPWEQVTVAGGSCLGADVAAKAAFLLGDRGPDWLAERGLPGRFLDADGTVVVSDAWARMLAPEGACT